MMHYNKSQLSVLISVYKSETAANLDKSLTSVFSQTLQPDQVVLVQDGPLNAELDQIISKWTTQEKKIITIALKQNSGLAVALNKGLERITADFIARMDSDDVCKPDRFQKQIEFLLKNQDVDVIGGWLEEIDENGRIVKDLVKFPVSHDECFSFFSRRNPLAHPAVVFRKRFFEKVGGGYDERFVGKNKQEDTELWFRGFKNGCVFANLPSVLLSFRRSSKFYERRSGLDSGLLFLKDRLKWNRSLGYGLAADLYAFGYFFMTISPGFVKRFLYQALR